jgi:hypothetical protein
MFITGLFGGAGHPLRLLVPGDREDRLPFGALAGVGVGVGKLIA